MHPKLRTKNGWRGKGRTGVLGGNFMLGRFFRGGKVRPGFFFSAGENLYWYTFSGGDSIPGRFFREKVLCGGKLYATTPGIEPGSPLRSQSNPLPLRHHGGLVPIGISTIGWILNDKMIIYIYGQWLKIKISSFQTFQQ